MKPTGNALKTASQNGQYKGERHVITYTVQEQLKPKGLQGISEKQIEQHWALYRGYVANTNALIEEIAKAEIGSRHWSELKRRAGFEFNGMVLHEYYFGNLRRGARIHKSALAGALEHAWGSMDAWEKDFTHTGAMRGIGWSILYHDPVTDHLFTWWVTEHSLNHPAGFNPILVLDVFEHAYMVDYGTSGRGEYIKAFLENVNWDVVEHRFNESRSRKIVSRF